ncbi:hypothetical protein J4Q44_G00193260 [Coregonus suidteri]|uniref:Niban 1/2/3 domain-containing protein n=1 Tax=Coregonus suidteri TaxID=861788 RepID=A0AAN8QU39_9TELE
MIVVSSSVLLHARSLSDASIDTLKRSVDGTIYSFFASGIAVYRGLRSFNFTMGASSSSLLDETKSNYIRGRAEAELKNFTPHYRQQYFVAFCSKLQEEVEQQKETRTQLLKQREPPRPEEVLYQDSVLQYDDTRKWKERFVVMRANHSLECHDNQESFSKGVPARQRLLPSGGVVLTSEEKYTALVDKAFPDPYGLKEETSPPVVVVPPGQFPVYLRLPYRRDAYFSFPQEDRRATFRSILTGCIRHQNHNSLRRSSCESQAFLKAIHFYRQEKGHYESWDMLVGCEEQVLTNLVLEELLPSLQTELLTRLKGKKAERKRVWFSTLDAAYHLVQDQLREGLKVLKEECRETARSQEALVRSDMDQIASSRAFLQAKLQASVSDPAVKFCSENVSPYLASILEELMSPVTGGFQGVRLLLEGEMNALCLGFPEGVGQEGFNQQYDHDSSTVRKRIFQEALVDITLPAIRRNLAPSYKPDLLKLDQYIFADYTNFIQVKNVYEDILLNILTSEVNKVLKEAASLRKNNLMVDSTDMQSAMVDSTDMQSAMVDSTDMQSAMVDSTDMQSAMVDSTDMQSASQSSLTDGHTPPLSAPASPAKMAVSGLSRQAERAPSPLVGNSPSSAGRLEVDMAALTPTVIIITPQTNPDAPLATTTPYAPLAAPEMQAAPGSEPVSPQPPLPVAEPAPQTPEVTDTAKASQPPGTEDKPAAARESPVSDRVSVCVEALAAMSMILLEATVPSTGQRKATDRAVYLKTPAGVKEGASVPLAVDEKEEAENTEAHRIGTAPSNAHVETVDSGSVHSDTPPEMKASGKVQTSSSTQARDTEPASRTQVDPNLNPKGSETQPGGGEDRATVTSFTGVTVTESQRALLACNTLVPSPEGATTPHTGLGEGVVEAGDSGGEALGLQSITGGMEGEEEEEEAVPLDSVKSIRDLVVEVVEVEEVIQRCPPGNSTP